uniref:Putative nickel insertion protein n=1 Tax=Geoglobus ahangari TaxID=113653 RepID=A0A7C4S5X8_9EURY
MRVAIFDAFSGASGNMIIGSMVGISLSEHDLEDVIKKLKLDIDFEIKIVNKRGISAKYLDVKERTNPRRFKEVVNLIKDSKLDSKVKKESLKIFERLARAEGTIHGKDYSEVVFHELGSDDAIFDIISATTGILRLKDRGYRIFTTPIRVGSGFIEIDHGKYPIPAPATLEVLKNSKVEITFDGECELLTPTGAAILSHFSEGKPHFTFEVEEVSYGAGKLDLEIPNVLRLILGVSQDSDGIIVLETTIDDMSGEHLSHALQKIAEKCYDVNLIQAMGKKGRPCYILKAITDYGRSETVAEEILRHTTSIGVRLFPVYHRIKARRKMEHIDISINGKKYSVRVKISDYTIKPEFDDIVRIAEETGISVREIVRKIERELDEITNGK